MFPSENVRTISNGEIFYWTFIGRNQFGGTGRIPFSVCFEIVNRGGRNVIRLGERGTVLPFGLQVNTLWFQCSDEILVGGGCTLFLYTCEGLNPLMKIVDVCESTACVCFLSLPEQFGGDGHIYEEPAHRE